MGLELSFKKNNINTIALIMLMFGEICFYTAGTIYLYYLLTGGTMLISFWVNRDRITRFVRINGFVFWLTAMYVIYLAYGILRLKAGDFNGVVLVYRYAEGIALYLNISSLLIDGNKKISLAFTIVGILSAIYLFSTEGLNIIVGSTRIGESLSGNVNTAGFNFGLISFFIMWGYCKNKKVSNVLLFLIFAFLMLITGSKKTLIILIADLVLLFYYERNRLSGWLKIIFIVVGGIYLIFNVPYLYNIIGYRIDSMISTLMYGSNSAIYSYSTDVRDEMIFAAFKLFQQHPIFGGGWNYFYSQTNYGFYSHCNYTEMLCTFGIMGTIIYYSRALHHLCAVSKLKKIVYKDEKELLVLAAILTIMDLILEWGAVTFSAQIIWYIPIIVSAAAVEKVQYLGESK